MLFGTCIRTQVPHPRLVPSGVKLKGGQLSSSEKAPVPKGAEWQKYLKDSDNKDELFQLLSEQLVQNTIDARCLLLTTKAGLALTNRPTDVTALSPCK